MWNYQVLLVITFSSSDNSGEVKKYLLYIWLIQKKIILMNQQIKYFIK